MISSDVKDLRQESLSSCLLYRYRRVSFIVSECFCKGIDYYRPVVTDRLLPSSSLNLFYCSFSNLTLELSLKELCSLAKLPNY